MRALDEAGPDTCVGSLILNPIHTRDLGHQSGRFFLGRALPADQGLGGLEPGSLHAIVLEKVALGSKKPDDMGAICYQR